MKLKIGIDVFFDFICPWCLIGKRQLQAAIQQLKLSHPEVEVEVKWLGVQLLPSIPVEGVPFKAFYLQRLGSRTAVKMRQEQVRQAAKAVEVDIDFERIARMPNTARAHRIFAHAMKLGNSAQHDLLLEKLFSAYFHQSENISDPAVLQKIAIECGYAQEQITELLAAPHLPFISANTGGKGVPYFVFDGSYAMAGAQPASALYKTMLDVLAVQRKAVV
ncbi:DsbA family oxidoreductase [Acinetobacter bohemicus]|uniref:DsbA family oxidoreductase n=1 Tax=Acinetobacter sp. S4397-1 TaxID=2972915 RepID=UPI00209B2FDE|nr:DsbA family oxidoreductase [Acinetobacter sp. S4397-1]MCO8045700.1 DsbA family oxidoreductase [Acinetobacter sp. S4397-1]